MFSSLLIFLVFVSIDIVAAQQAKQQFKHLTEENLDLISTTRPCA